MAGQALSSARDPWVTDWDEKMVKHLLPLAGERFPPKMHLLFFANTYPLIHHYALALKRHRRDPRKFIQLGGWKGQKVGKRTISYTNTPLDFSANFCVTKFNPRWAFVPLTPLTSQIWRECFKIEERRREDWRPERDCLAASTCRSRNMCTSRNRCGAPKLSDFLDCARTDGYESISIYAELEDLGACLANQIAPVFPSFRQFFAKQKHDSLPILADSYGRPGQNDLRIFIYGGSLSSYLMGKDNRYVPLALERDDELPDTMNLHIAAPAEYETTLKLYHQDLYGNAIEGIFGSESGDVDHHERDQCPPFFTVYRGYNELAWLLQHRSSFKDADGFADCLRDHHVKGSQPEA